MLKRYLIGVDLGTSGTKAALYDLDGQLISESSQEIPIKNPKPGVVEQNQEDFYLSAVSTIRDCIQKSQVSPEEIAAIAFDSQMAGVGLIDENYQPVENFDSWLDMRCKPFIELMDREAGDLITRLTGCPPTCDHGPKMLWWKSERPESFKRTAKFLMPSAYVAGKMAGLKGDQGFIDYTFLHFSGFADAQKGTWSQELCDKFDVDMDKLPRILQPWDVIGEVTDKAAKESGLMAGTIIAAGAGDTAANALGAGIVHPGMVFDVAGTASVLAGTTDTFVADTRHRALLTMRSVIPGLWNPLAYIGGGGLALRWYRDQFFNTFQGRQEKSESDLYDEMTRYAQTAPAGSDGLFFSPHLGGRICPSSPEMRGAWIGFSWSHNQSHFFRAILEGVAYEYNYYLEILRELLPNLQLLEARCVGGGARSDFWNQIKADVLNIPYQRLQGNEFGSWGAAMIAGKAAGLIPDLALKAAESAKPSGTRIIPNLENHIIYKPLSKKYIGIQKMLETHFNPNM